MSLAYPGPTSTLSEVVARDAFLEALDDPQLRIRILEREPTTLDEALRIACHYEALERDSNPETGGKWKSHDSGHRRDPGQVRMATATDPVNRELSTQLEELRKMVTDYQHQMAETRRELEELRNARTVQDTGGQFGAPFAYGTTVPDHGTPSPTGGNTGQSETNGRQKPPWNLDGQRHASPHSASNRKLDGTRARSAYRKDTGQEIVRERIGTKVDILTVRHRMYK